MPTIQLTLPYKHTEEDLANAAALNFGENVPFRITKRSVDARSHRNIVVIYSITDDSSDPVEPLWSQIQEQKRLLERNPKLKEQKKLVVVGTGPGGLFCAYWLLLHGLQPVILEQGPPMPQRLRDMALFIKQGTLNPYSNVCFGAGGAGTYSDGKLITRIRSPYIHFILETFVRYGAPDEIRYLYNPHLGSNRIRRCIHAMLTDMEIRGAEMRYNTRFQEFNAEGSNGINRMTTSTHDIENPDAVFAAFGHSSRETYKLFRTHDVAMECKEFAVGVRVEHPARVINAMQYGLHYEQLYGGIETAQYKAAQTWKDEGRAVYSFCMCPGGYVINASTDTNGIVTNGMSNASKSGRFSNSAIVVNVSKRDLEFMKYDGIDAGLEFQKHLEERFRATVNALHSSHRIPGQRLQDFLEGRPSAAILPSSSLTPAAPAQMHKLFPSFMYDALQKGFRIFNDKMKGFSITPSAQIFGVESRTSSPYRILRDDDLLTSPSHPNMYPIGEGAGYAGGITSAAVDGIRCAQAYILKLLETS